MRGFVMEKPELLYKLQILRWVSLVLGICNVGLILIGGYLTFSSLPRCNDGFKLPVVIVSLASGLRICYMVWIGKIQILIGTTISNHVNQSSIIVDSISCHEIRARYRRWIWLTRLGMIFTVVQFVLALYLTVTVFNGSSRACFSGGGWEYIAMISFVVIAWLVVTVQWATGSDVLRWRSFYASHDTAWQAHYSEVFDNGIREVLCCLGRAKYLSVLEDDEVHMVARLLGDLMAYRASGTGHLELLAGLALLQKHKPTQFSYSYTETDEAPKSVIREAAFFHPFAEAAYTGPLLDLGRNPLVFPCVWVYRQGALTPWSRNRRPVLEGDNWWRGHAAAFLNFVNLGPETLRMGRVCQKKRESAYFVVIMHQIKTVIISVRGTETPEDLITDGLCGECSLSVHDLDGLLNSNKLDPLVRERVISSFPHYGHSGIAESARELYMKLEGEPSDIGNGGCLSSLLGDRGECYGYKIRILGHSLGGAVATLLGIRLYARFPKLHVYSYGPLPCVDSTVAEACSSFVTSIVYNDEFSARLSINSITRLRSKATETLSNDCSKNSFLLTNVIKKITNPTKTKPNHQANTSTITTQDGANNNQIHNKHIIYNFKGGAFLCGHAISCMMHSDSNINTNLNIESLSQDNLSESDPGDKSIDSVPMEGNVVSHVVSSNGGLALEMFLAGLVVHLVPSVKGGSSSPFWKNWRGASRNWEFNAYVANRERFMDIVVSPYMFLDHLPWRCQNAMLKVLESRKRREQDQTHLFTEEMV